MNLTSPWQPICPPLHVSPAPTAYWPTHRPIHATVYGQNGGTYQRNTIHRTRADSRQPWAVDHPPHHHWPSHIAWHTLVPHGTQIAITRHRLIPHYLLAYPHMSYGERGQWLPQWTHMFIEKWPCVATCMGSDRSLPTPRPRPHPPGMQHALSHPH